VSSVLRRCGPLVAVFAGAVLFALGTGCASLSWVKASQLTGPYHYVGLYRANAALHASGFLALSVGLILAGWTALRSPGTASEDRAEIVWAVVASLIVVGGYCKIAASASYDSSGHLIVTVGLALWAPLALARGAHHTAAARRGEAADRQLAVVWSAASLGVLSYAIGYDFVPVGPDGRTNGVVSGVLGAVGACLIAYALVSARRRDWLSPVSTNVTVWGILALAISEVGYAITNHINLGPNTTFDRIRYGFGLDFGASAIAVAVLAGGALVQSRHLDPAMPHAPS
jgi:hypothetical protein